MNRTYVYEIRNFEDVHVSAKVLETFNFIFVSHESIDSVASAHQISDNARSNVASATLEN